MGKGANSPLLHTNLSSKFQPPPVLWRFGGWSLRSWNGDEKSTSFLSLSLERKRERERDKKNPGFFFSLRPRWMKDGGRALKDSCCCCLFVYLVWISFFWLGLLKVNKERKGEKKTSRKGKKERKNNLVTKRFHGGFHLLAFFFTLSWKI